MLWRYYITGECMLGLFVRVITRYMGNRNRKSQDRGGWYNIRSVYYSVYINVLRKIQGNPPTGVDLLLSKEKQCRIIQKGRIKITLGVLCANEGSAFVCMPKMR